MKIRRVSQSQKLLALLLLVTIPLLVFAVVRQRFELRQRAASNEPSTCYPAGNQITVTPPGSSGTCHDLQMAINSAPDGATEPFYIYLTAGTYVIPENGELFSIIIQNRSKLVISGTTNVDPNAVHLVFQNNRGGILIQNSTNISIGFMDISGHTANGLFSSRSSSGVFGNYLSLADTGAHTLDVSGGMGFSLFNCNVQSMAGAIDIEYSDHFEINTCDIHNATNGITIGNSFGTLKKNTIHGLAENGITIASSTVVADHNTITDNALAHIANQGGLTIRNYGGNPSDLTLTNTILYQNYNGIIVEDLATTTIRAEYNDIYGNILADSALYQYPNGTNGNIGANPDFGPDYCVKPGSPAIYAEGGGTDQIMGSKGVCVGIFPSPTINPKYTCTTDADCGCALDTSTNSCAIENNQYLSGHCTAPDFCSGISGTCHPGCNNGFCNLVCPGVASPTPTAANPPSPTGSALLGDIIVNGQVDIFDYNELVAHFGQTGDAGFTPSDIDRDGTVGIFDYNIIVENFGRVSGT